MTHLEANLKDFHLVRGDANDPERITAYTFRFGQCEDFQTTMDDFKGGVPANLRKPDPEKNWLWTVQATAGTYVALGRVFDNFVELYETEKAQLRLF